MAARGPRSLWITEARCSGDNGWAIGKMGMELGDAGAVDA